MAQFKIDLPQQDMFSNVLSGYQGMLGIPEQIARNKLLQATAQEKMAGLPFAGRTAEANALYKEAMARYLASPAKQVQGMTPVGKALIESHLFKNGYPINIGGNQPSDQNMHQATGGINLPSEQQDLYSSYLQKLGTNPKQASAAQSAQELYNNINNVDIAPLKEFSGAKGQVKYYKEKAKSLFSTFGLTDKPSQQYQDYQAFQDFTKNQIIDSMRQALQTSVVPDYVYKTIAPMLSPEASIWSNPEQVEKSWGVFKKWAEKNAREKTESYAKGVPTTVKEAENRYNKNNNKYSDEDIAFTAQQYGLTKDQVIEMLGEE